uniref:Uncharacterized protein n=2 Tax=Anguilla anguilla TaxID=7936 RepID=A0A0E9SAP3_ANGAN
MVTHVQGSVVLLSIMILAKVAVMTSVGELKTFTSIKEIVYE